MSLCSVPTYLVDNVTVSEIDLRIFSISEFNSEFTLKCYLDYEVGLTIRHSIIFIKVNDMILAILKFCLQIDTFCKFILNPS